MVNAQFFSVWRYHSFTFISKDVLLSWSFQGGQFPSSSALETHHLCRQCYCCGTSHRSGFLCVPWFVFALRAFLSLCHGARLPLSVCGWLFIPPFRFAEFPGFQVFCCSLSKYCTVVGEEHKLGSQASWHFLGKSWTSVVTPSVLVSSCLKQGWCDTYFTGLLYRSMSWLYVTVWNRDTVRTVYWFTVTMISIVHSFWRLIQYMLQFHFLNSLIFHSFVSWSAFWVISTDVSSMSVFSFSLCLIFCLIYILNFQFNFYIINLKILLENFHPIFVFKCVWSCFSVSMLDHTINSLLCL